MGEEKKKRADETDKNMGAADAGSGGSGSEPPESSNSMSTGYAAEVSHTSDFEVSEDWWPSDNDDLDVVLSESEITSPMESLRRAAEAKETAENPRKCPRLSNSAMTREEMQVTRDSTDSAGCEHLFIPYEDLDFILRGINEAVLLPQCEHNLCKEEADGVSKEVAGMMVCLGCERHFCTEGSFRDSLQGHAREHAILSDHWVALWYNDPYTGHCFQCECVLRLDDYLGDYDDNGKDEWRMVVRHDELECAGATGNGYVINGLLNLGNTCYMNALVQCLLALGKLRTMMLGPDAPLGTLGVRLKDLFLETSVVARCTLNPESLLEHIHELFPKFKPNQMHDSHELLRSLCDTLDREAHELTRHSIIDSIFRGHLRDIISCNRCSNTSVTHSIFDDLAVPLPSKSPPVRSVASPPMTKKRRSATPRKLRRTLFPTIDESIEETDQAIAEGGDSQVPDSQLGDVAVEIPKPLQVDSPKVKQIWQRKETRKNVVPGEIIKVPVKVVDFIPYSFDDNFEGMGESTADSLNPGDIDPPPLSSLQAKERTHAVEVTTKDKGEAHSSDTAYDDAPHVNYIGSIEDCLSLLLRKHTIEWRCDNCSKVAELPSTNTIKDGEQKMASTNVNTRADGDQPEQTDMKTCQNEQSSDLNSLTVECTSSSSQPLDSVAHHQLSLDRITKGITSGASYDEKYPASCRTTDQIPECHEVVQEAVPSYLPTDKQANLLSAQDTQGASTQNQGSGKQVKLDDHSAHQVEENQNEQKDRNGLPIQTHFISKLPPVLTIQIKRYSSELSKLEGHVSFKEVLDVGPFMDPSCEDKDNSTYRLAGIVEHLGPSLSVGHYVAYLRGGPKPQSSDSSSSWFRASDSNIKEVDVEEVLRCEAYLLFYERVEDQGIEPTN